LTAKRKNAVAPFSLDVMVCDVWCRVDVGTLNGSAALDLIDRDPSAIPVGRWEFELDGDGLLYARRTKGGQSSR
jgi:hypothetical protein